MCLPMQETWAQSLVEEDPTRCGATEPKRHNYSACTLQPGNHNCWSLHAPEPVLCNKRPLQWEAWTLQQRGAPACHQLHKHLCSKEDPAEWKTRLNVGEDMEQLELPCCTNKSVKWYNCFGKLVGNFLRVKHVSRKFFSQDRVTGTGFTLLL